MQHAFGLTDEQVAAGLGAMRAVASANGVDEAERDLIDACAQALGAPPPREDASPERVAKAFPDELWRRRVLQAMVATALIDGEATREELAIIDRYAKALERDEPWVKMVHRLVDGQMWRLRFDFGRRLPIPRKLMTDMWKDEGVKGLWKVYRTFSLKGTDEPELAWKYKRLGLLPEGTLGREFWKHMTSRKFAFPGEPAGLLEKQCHHDLTHVLTGYDTDPAGECQIAAFYAGYEKQEPFGYIFMVLVMFQVGVKLAPGTTVSAAKMQLDPAPVLRAMERGSHIKVDLTNDWNFWPEMERPIDDVRRECNVV